MAVNGEVNSSSTAGQRCDRYPSQLIADRIVRALTHRLRLLHRSGRDFFILGATGNVYTVTFSDDVATSCTCPDRTVPCKHILFVFLRVLGLPAEDACLHRRSLRPCQISRLLQIPTSPCTLADARTREHFHLLFSAATCEGASVGERRREELEDGSATCPVCLEEMINRGAGKANLTCRTCLNSVHGECFSKWKRSRGRRPASCVVCRAKWREFRPTTAMQTYINLGVAAGEYEDGGQEEDVHLLPPVSPSCVE